ncbi:MAG: DoxX family membrane protein [Pseudobacteriovorax sp.]|nr:DoxX family membrane protein [Pseudobacteriovorax sp.]
MMKTKLHTISRVLFGLIFLVFGLNGFLQFMPTPPVTESAGALLGALAQTGYFFPMIKIIEILVGILLLANVFAPLAAVVITPVLIGITSIHIFLNPAGLPMMIVLHVVHGFIVFGYKAYYQKLFAKKATAF